MMKPKTDKNLVPSGFCNENVEQRKENQFHVNQNKSIKMMVKGLEENPYVRTMGELSQIEWVCPAKPLSRNRLF